MRDILRYIDPVAGFIERYLFEIVPHELLVVAFLVPAGFILVTGPESRRVRSQDFIDEYDTFVTNTPLELGVGKDNPAGLRVLAGFVEDFNALGGASAPADLRI